MTAAQRMIDATDPATSQSCLTATAGAEIDRKVSSMQGKIAVPRSNGEIVFDAPWQSRAFGLAVTLSRAGYFTWDTFRGELARAIAANGQNGVDEYYLRWLDALEACIAGNGFYDPAILRTREDEYRDHTRDDVF